MPPPGAPEWRVGPAARRGLAADAVSAWVRHFRYQVCGQGSPWPRGGAPGGLQREPRTGRRAGRAGPSGLSAASRARRGLARSRVNGPPSGRGTGRAGRIPHPAQRCRWAGVEPAGARGRRLVTRAAIPWLISGRSGNSSRSSGHTDCRFAFAALPLLPLSCNARYRRFSDSSSSLAWKKRFC